MLVFLLTVQRGDILIWLQADGFLLDGYHGCIVGALSPKTPKQTSRREIGWGLQLIYWDLSAEK